MNAFYMKKWYFDFVTEKNEVFYGYFIIYEIFGRKTGLVSAHLILPDGDSLRGALRVRSEQPSPDGSIKLGPHYLMKMADRTRCHMELGGLAIDLESASHEEEWIPEKGALLLERNGRFLKWHVPQPSALVEGKIVLGRRELIIAGRGYQDIVETNIPPWRLPLVELLWGRAHCGRRCVVFNRITTRDGAVLQNFHLSGGTDAGALPGGGGEWRAATRAPAAHDQRFDVLAEDDDRLTTIVKEDWTLALERRVVIEDAPVTTGERHRVPLLRKALARKCGDPLERKMLSKASLSDGKIRLDGMAVHERVVWRWKTR